MKHGVSEEDLHKSYEKYLKNLIEECFENFTFQKSPRTNEPDCVCSSKAGGHALDVVLNQCEADNFSDIFQLGKLIRSEMEQYTRWQFSGTFDAFNPSFYVSSLMQLILLGSNQSLTSEPKDYSFEKTVSLATQFMM